MQLLLESVVEFYFDRAVQSAMRRARWIVPFENDDAVRAVLVLTFILHGCAVWRAAQIVENRCPGLGALFGAVLSTLFTALVWLWACLS